MSFSFNRNSIKFWFNSLLFFSIVLSFLFPFFYFLPFRELQVGILSAVSSAENSGKSLLSLSRLIFFFLIFFFLIFFYFDFFLFFDFLILPSIFQIYIFLYFQLLLLSIFIFILFIAIIFHIAARHLSMLDQ